MNLHGDSAVAGGQQRLSVKQSTSQRFNVELIARICDHNTYKVWVLHHRTCAYMTAGILKR